MKRKIGVLVDGLEMERIDDAIAKAAEIGADGIQAYCTRGKLAPENLDPAARKAFRKQLEALNLELAALCGDLFKGFLNEEANRMVVPRMKAFVDLAVDLGTKVVTSHIGTLPDDETSEAWSAGLRAFDELGAYAEAHGCVVAMETGPEEPALMKRFLDKIGNRGIGVNYDPANLAMRGFDHLGGVLVLKDYIVHTHAKDGVCLMGLPSTDGDPARARYAEARLGMGSVAFPYYLWALGEIGYGGYLTIEREAGDNRIRDVAEGIRFLRDLMPWDGVS